MSTDLWETPQALFNVLHREFRFVLDVCALPSNAKCEKYFTPDSDGLSQIWNGTRCHSESVWMNPPYGRGIDKWIEKAFNTSLSGVRVVTLLPARTNAPWWHDYVMKSREIRFIRKKVSFGGPVRGVPFWGSAIVVFGPGISRGGPFVSTHVQVRDEVRA